MVLAVLVLGEDITLSKISGGTLILFSLILLTRAEKRAEVGRELEEEKEKEELEKSADRALHK